MQSLAHQKIYIAGHTGLVGSALLRYFKNINATIITAKRSQLDLTRQEAVFEFIKSTLPDIVIISAGRVGGIQANSKFPAEFIYENLSIEANLIHAAWKCGIKRLLNFGSSCVYPKLCPQPMAPDKLMTGLLEPTNEPYAIAKIAGLSLCSSYNQQYGTSFINAIPSNLFGPGDTFDLERCHVISALIRKFHEAKKNHQKKVTLWGSGNVKRDFLYIDDFAEACALLLQFYKKNEPINIGAEAPCTIKELASVIAEVTGFEGNIDWDKLKPDGAPERVLDATAIESMGWKPKTNLRSGIQKTYEWFLETMEKRGES